jgi:outer membrane autotransporter protein
MPKMQRWYSPAQTNFPEIYNDGALSVSGDLTLDGGISGSGTTTFAKDTNISVKVNDTTISNTVVNNGANLNLIFSDSFDGEYTLVSGSLDNEFNGYDSNSLYNISSVKNGTYKVSKKSTDEIVESLATTKDTANVIDALTSGKSEDNTAFNNIAGNINDMLQSGDSAKVKAAIDAATAVSTETAPMIHHVQTTNVNQIFGAVASRLSSGSVAGNQGISSGDSILERGAVWLKGIYNRAKLENDTIKNKKGFTADSNGVAFGAEKYFGDSVKAGLGYAYTDTDVDGFLRDTDIDTNTAFVYGEYKPNNWFVNAIASYNWSDYKEEKSVLGNQIKGDYDVDTVAAQIMTGYDFHFGTTKITPSAGLRYVHVKQDAYTDTLGSRVDDNKYDIWTAVAGASISKDFTYKNIVLRPEVRAAATYDLKNDDASANVVLANNAAYHVNGESLKRFGVEVGAGLTAELTDSIEVSAAYEGRFRQNYYDNTGMLSAKYKF